MNVSLALASDRGSYCQQRRLSLDYLLFLDEGAFRHIVATMYFGSTVLNLNRCTSGNDHQSNGTRRTSRENSIVKNSHLGHALPPFCADVSIEQNHFFSRMSMALVLPQEVSRGHSNALDELPRCIGPTCAATEETT